jgi:hypothetical protein
MTSKINIINSYNKLIILTTKFLHRHKDVTTNMILAEHTTISHEIGHSLKTTIDNKIASLMPKINNNCDQASLAWKYGWGNYDAILPCVGVAKSALLIAVEESFPQEL